MNKRVPNISKPGEFWVAALAFALLLGGCELPADDAPVPSLDYNYFSCEVQPVLARECSFPACHGNMLRPFRVLSPGRMRLAEEYEIARRSFAKEDAKAGIYAPLTETELRFNYDQSMGFVSTTSPATTSQMLTRPLAYLAGGSYHAIYGEHPLIGEICASTRDLRCESLQLWLAGNTSPGACP